MAKKGHTEEQILRALRQAEGGSRVTDICREHGNVLHLEEEVFGTWLERAARVSVSCARRTRSLSIWSRICHWIGTSSRRSCKKSCEASSSTRAWALDAERLRAEHTAGVGADDDQSIDHELLEPA